MNETSRVQSVFESKDNLAANLLLQQIVPTHEVSEIQRERGEASTAYRMMMLKIGMVVMMAARGKM